MLFSLLLACNSCLFWTIGFIVITFMDERSGLGMCLTVGWVLDVCVYVWFYLVCVFCYVGVF